MTNVDAGHLRSVWKHAFSKRPISEARWAALVEVRDKAGLGAAAVQDGHDVAGAKEVNQSCSFLQEYVPGESARVDMFHVAVADFRSIKGQSCTGNSGA